MKFQCCVLISGLLATAESYSEARISIHPTAYNRLRLGSASLFTRLAIVRDEMGYEVKPKDWFNGLSLDPGASLTDPRAVPVECKQFADRIKSGGDTTLQETISLLDKHYDYFEVRI